MMVRTPAGTSRALLCIAILSFSTTSALQVVPGSPCSPQCTIGGTSSTNASEIVCSDVEFNSTSTGLKFKECIECLQGSRQFSGDDTDVARFLYNLRYAADVCLFGFPEAHNGKTSACATDYVCNPLQTALKVNQLNVTSSNEFEYCKANGSVFRSQDRTTCMGCLQASPNSKYLSNFLVALEAGCEQQPLPGALLGLSGSLFGASLVNITGNTTASSQDDTSSHLSTGAIAGIAVAIGIIFLAGIILFIMYYRRQKRYNKEDRARRASYASFLHSSPYSPYKWQNIDTTIGGPNFTMDYKSPGSETEQVELTQNGNHLFGGGTGAYTYNNRPQPTHARQYSQDEAHESSSAMPTHPAYIPRAVIRRNSLATGNTSQFSSTLHSREPSVDSQGPFKLSAPPPIRKPAKSRLLTDPSDLQSYPAERESTSSTDYHQHPQQREHANPPSLPTEESEPTLDTDIHQTAVRQLQQHGIYAADQPQPHHHPDPSPRHNQIGSLASSATNRERSSSTSSTSAPRSQLQHPRSRPDLPHLILPGSGGGSSSNNPPAPRKPITKKADVPLPGLESIEISGPLAFPGHQQQQQQQQQLQSPGSGGLKTGSSTTSSNLGFNDRRTFRERSDSGGAGVGVVGPGAARFAAGAIPVNHGIFQDHVVQQNFIRKGWVEEVPLQSTKDSLW